MKQYLEALKKCLDNGIDVESRAGKVRKNFGYQMRFNFEDGFPILTTKKIAWKSVISELLWFIEGSSDERRLAEIHYGKTRTELNDKKTIWTKNANADYWKSKAKYEGDLGKIYGVQWRNFNGVDQLDNLIKGLKKDPNGRRHVLSAWNPSELTQMALPPCHIFSQYFVANNKLSCHLYQRSCDMFLGVPFNISSYSLLTHLLAKECDLELGDFIHTFGDYHIYHEHFPQVEEQLDRIPKKLPKLKIKQNNLFSYHVEDFELIDYQSYPSIKAEMSV